MLSLIVVEDHDTLREQLVDHFVGLGWAVQAVPDAAGLAQLMQQARRPDVVLLDLNLPDADGLAVAQQLRRADAALGIVMLTARGSAMERAQGYQSGADVYLTKPASVDELQSVLLRLARRVESLRVAPLPWVFQFDRRGQQLGRPGRPVMPLSGVETCLLDLLSRSPGSAVTAAALLEQLAERGHGVWRLEGLRVVMSRLRQKAKRIDPLGGAFIRADQGGYRLLARLQYAGLSGAAPGLPPAANGAGESAQGC
jgi:DNA-binding response OmpR family regulator